MILYLCGTVSVYNLIKCFGWKFGDFTDLQREKP